MGATSVRVEHRSFPGGCPDMLGRDVGAKAVAARRFMGRPPKNTSHVPRRERDLQKQRTKGDAPIHAAGHGIDVPLLFPPSRAAEPYQRIRSA